MPSAYQTQRSALSALHVSALVNAEHGSGFDGGVVGGSGGGQSQGAHAVFGGQVGQAQPDDEPAEPVVAPPVAVPVPDTPMTPAPQAQSHGGQVWPGAHAGQAQVQVPWPQPVPPPPPEEPPAQSQLQGAQLSPGAQVGQAQVHVPPPLLPVPAEQSHCTAGHSAFGGQATG